MSDHEKPKLQVSAPNTGKGVGLVIPDVLRSDQPITIIDRRGDLSQYYQKPGADA